MARLLYPLPEPYRGATHVDFYEVLVTPNVSVRLTGNLGTLADGEFVQDPDLRDVVRSIDGREYTEGFKPYVQAQGAPGGNFRDADLGYWLTAWAWQSAGAWEIANPAPEPAPEPVE